MIVPDEYELLQKDMVSVKEGIVGLKGIFESLSIWILTFPSKFWWGSNEDNLEP